MAEQSPSWAGSDIYGEFVVEGYENLDQLERDLVVLERTPRDAATLASIFRTMHTIKGTAGMLGLSRVEAVTHAAESLLGRLRDGELVIDAAMTSTLLAASDLVRRMLGKIETEGQEGDDDVRIVTTALTLHLESEGAADYGSIGVPSVDPPVPPAVDGGGTISEPGPAVEKVLKSLETVESRGVEGDLGEGSSTRVDSSIRVDVGLLDRLMTMVGELVLTRNQILQFTGGQSNAALNATTQRLNLITTELQESVMKTRMQPIGNVWSRFPRIARDISTMLGKCVRVEMEGSETELDKTLIEAIKDPLTHIVRNAIDHGIEAPHVRSACGKNPEGCLLLRSFHEGGLVNIEISDDGAGIDPERVRERALRRGLVTAEQVARLGDRELVNLIFLPGFSTADQVTSVSGRGVGMDVVKTNVERIGGTIDVHSTPGRGTSIRIKIPLTLAIIPALIITTGGFRYAIPQVSLLELVRLEGQEACRRVEFIHRAPVYRLRGNLLPLVSLRRELRLPGSGEAADFAANADEIINIVVLQADDRQFGLLVDGINDTEEIVVKPLSSQMKGISAYAGATIMGDGRVALILDVLGLAQRAHVVTDVGDKGRVDRGAQHIDQDASRQSVLLCAAGRQRRLAIPLSMISRLEEFPRHRVEFATGTQVVQYRGEILPLVPVSDFVGYADDPAEGDPDDPLHVVVHLDGERRLGLVVDAILDIVDDRLQIQPSTARRGLLGSAVIAGRVTDVLDVASTVQSYDASVFSGARGGL